MKRKTILLIHFFFWFYIINQALFPLYIGGGDKAYMEGVRYFKDVLITMMLNVASFYTIYCLFPRFLRFRNRVPAIISGLVILSLITAFRTPVEFLFWKFFGNMPDNELIFKWVYMWNNLRLAIITGIYAVLIRFMINAFESRKLSDELINQRQAGEIALLRSQVNSHFLFNTLNNIYSLVYRKSDDAAPAVMKLSSIMRYMLYDANADQVPLEKEIEYLKSFIELQKLRMKDPDFVSFHIEGNVELRFIAPMLLISFVENAFRHGSRKQHPGIIIRLETSDEKIHFEVINYLRKVNLTKSEHDGGTGLANIRRRLALIYPGRHKLLINEDPEKYRVNLEILNQREN